MTPRVTTSPVQRFGTLRRIIEREGLRSGLGWAAYKLRLEIVCSWRKLTRRERTFQFEGLTFRYLMHPRNTTWSNERAVEIPIIWRLVQQHQGEAILELGNTLANYHDVAHDIVDKYEPGPGVINVDIVDFRPMRLYDLIVSVSTIEHVGWDEEDVDPEKTKQTLEHLASLLKPGGLMAITFPLGHNPHLDAFFRNGQLPFTRSLFMQRISSDNRWRQVSYSQVADARYGSPFEAANAVVIATYRRDA